MKTLIAKLVAGLFGKQFGKARTLLSGKKTYLTAIAGIVGALLGWINGELETYQFVMAIIALIEAMNLRAGIEKTKK